MALYGTITVEDCFILSLKSLREAGYLKPGKTKSDIITFTPYEGKKAQFEIQVSMLEDPFLQLSYQTYDHLTRERNSITYQVPVEAFPANIGGGERYYFRCPETGLRCLKLYCPPGEKYFFHRLAFPYLIYQKQTESKAYRAMANFAQAELAIAL